MSKNKKSAQNIQVKPVLDEKETIPVEEKTNVVAQEMVKVLCPRCKKETEGEVFCGDCGRLRVIK
jgi:hypothetical protein